MAKILIIEDEAVLQKALSDMFNEYNHKTIQAIDGDQGVELAKKEKPDVILLDLVLPKRHGLEVLQELKNTESTKTIPVVVLTNLEDKDDIQKALEFGARAYLVKANYDMQEVISKVEECINASN